MTSPTPPRWQGTGLTDIGLVRRSNQDAFLVSNEHALYIVADGMGGRAGGDVASRLTIETFQDALQDLGTRDTQATDADIETFLRRTAERANRRIREEAQRLPELTGMGTTLVAVVLREAAQGTVAHIAHAGDSRAYLFHANHLEPLTRDHSVVEDLIHRGALTRAEAATHPQRHIITRALGVAATVEPDYRAVPLHQDDRLLLCTDGLNKMMEDMDIAAAFASASTDRSALCRALVDESNRRGGVDNITVLVCST